MYMRKQSKPRVIQALVWISVCPLYRFVYVYITHERQLEAIHIGLLITTRTMSADALTRSKPIFLMCKNMNITLNEINTWNTLECMRLDSTDPWTTVENGQMIVVHLKWQTAFTEQMLPWVITGDCNIVLALQSIWRIHSSVWDVFLFTCVNKAC